MLHNVKLLCRCVKF